MIEENSTTQSTQCYNLLFKSASEMPEKSDEVLPGLLWGDCAQLFTPAFWKFQYNLFQSGVQNEINYRLGETLLEEIVACLLGGYGIPAEVGLMAFSRLKELNLILPKIDFEQIHSILLKPFNMNGKSVKYRFANQKAKYIHCLLDRDDIDNIPSNNSSELRDWLMNLDGIGYKTASWITRNWLNSDHVAILDIHIIRAGILAGFYDNTVDVTKNYLKLERKYLDFCSAIDVDSSKMDAIIWEVMKKNNRLAISYITAKHY